MILKRWLFTSLLTTLLMSLLHMCWLWSERDLLRQNAVRSLNIAVQIQPQSHKEIEEVKTNKPLRTITHVFSSYMSPMVDDEFNITVTSWELARERALEHGLRVEYVGVVLEHEKKSVPRFTDKVIVVETDLVNFRGNPVPNFGSIFQAARNNGTSDIVIYTNCDIALYPDFYLIAEREMTHVEERFWNATTQLRLIDETTHFINRCTSVEPKSYEYGQNILKKISKVVPSKTSKEQCQLDALVFFEEIGGIIDKRDSRPLLQSSKALLRLLGRRAARVTMGQDHAFKKSIYLSFGGIEEHMDEDVADLEDQSFDLTLLGMVQGNRFDMLRWPALTITRQEILTGPSHFEIREMVFPKGKATDYAKLYPRRHDITVHPGNDCFIMPRNHIPKSLIEFRHPLGMRPSGMWIPDAFRSDPRFFWRRIVGHKDLNITFHVGSGLDEYLDRLARPGSETMLHEAALWDASNQHSLLKTLRGAFVGRGDEADVFFTCHDINYFRNAEFCSELEPADCRGAVRLGCSPYWHALSRDMVAYLNLCLKLARREKKSNNVFTIEGNPPTCQLCKSLFDSFPNPRDLALAFSWAETICARFFYDQCKMAKTFPKLKQLPVTIKCI